MIPLPTLSEADPEIAGEGSIDPLGLAVHADRLADLLAPAVRARMSRIRFVTAIAIGAMVGEALWDEPPRDGVSNPAICFEWLVLESFARKRDVAVLQATGIPGSSKAQAVISQGKRLNASNYLKTPSVFGFNGVYQPLARDLRVIGDDRMPGERAIALVAIWEREQGFSGFVDQRSGSTGGNLRGRLKIAVRDALREGRCSVSGSAHLWKHLARSLGPTQAGARERECLRGWLLDAEKPVRRELALAIDGRDDAPEQQMLQSIRGDASHDLRTRIDAVFAYEHFCRRLQAVFDTWRHASTLQGTQPLTPAAAAGNATIEQAANELPRAYASMCECLEPFDMLVPVESKLGRFADRLTSGQLVEQVLEYHYEVQGSKNKRAWFEPYGPGVVVRPMYRQGEVVGIDDETFLHPFRVTSMWQFMQDTRS